MNASDPFKTYTETVCEQIRWKKAHAAVAKELTDHLFDQKEAYLSCGDSEVLAEEKALRQMGDPVEIGAALDSTHKPAPQWGMLSLALLLLGIGTFLQIQLLPLLAKNWMQEAITARLYITPFLAVITLLLFYHIDFSFFGKHPYLLPTLLLVSILIKELFGISVNGTTYLPLITGALSPTLHTLLFPLGLSCILYRFRRYGARGYLGVCFLAAYTVGILFGYFSIASSVIFIASTASVLTVASFRNWFGTKTKFIFFTFAITGIFFAVSLLFFGTYSQHRITYMLHPETDPYGFGYLPLLIRTVLADAQLFGSGSTLSENFLIPSALTDEFYSEYFLTCITYRFGWVVSVSLVLLLAGFLFLGFRKCLKQKSILGQMISLSILSVFTAECFLYILANLGYPFISSASLPFLAYGKNSALIHMALTGILLSVFRTGDVQLDIMHSIEEKSFLEWGDGFLTIHFPLFCNLFFAEETDELDPAASILEKENRNLFP